MFVKTEDDDSDEIGVAKTSDPDKFVQLAIKSSDSLLGKLLKSITYFNVATLHTLLISNFL